MVQIPDPDRFTASTDSSAQEDGRPSSRMASPGRSRSRAIEERSGAALYCGAGGSCLGLQEAGITMKAGVDADPHALATYAAAGFHPVRHHISVEQPFPEALAALLYRIQVLWASPPCQPWSNAGKRLGSDDDRDGWIATLHAVARLRPHWFVAENVRGVEGYLDAVVLPVLRALGYIAERRLLDAASVGVPQRRMRVFIVAGPVPFPWPAPTHGDPRKPQLGLLPWRTMGEALGLTGQVLTGMNSQRAHGVIPVVVGTNHPAPTVRAQTGTGFTFVEEADSQGSRVHPLNEPAPTLTGASSEGGGRSLYVMGASSSGRGRPHSPEELAPAITTKGTAEFVEMEQVLAGTRGAKGPVKKSAEEPSYTVSTAGDLYVVRAYGGGTNPHRAGQPDERALRDLTDEPSTTISTGSHADTPFIVFAPNPVAAWGPREEEDRYLSRPSPAVLASEDRGAKHYPRYDPARTPPRASDALWRACKRRRLTPEECAILQDFPLDYPWKGTKTSQYRQIGNAVPRSLARSLGRKIVELLDEGHRMPLPPVGRPPSVARFFPCPTELGGCGAAAGEACRGRAWGQHSARRALAGLEPYPSGTTGAERRKRAASEGAEEPP